MDGKWRLLKGTNTKTQRFGSMMSFSTLHWLVVCWLCWSPSKRLFGRIGPPSDSSNSAGTFQKSHEIPSFVQSSCISSIRAVPWRDALRHSARRCVAECPSESYPGAPYAWWPRSRVKFDDQNLGVATLAPMSPILWTMGCMYGMGGMGGIPVLTPQKKQLGGFLLWSLGFTWLYQNYDSSLSPSPSPRVYYELWYDAHLFLLKTEHRWSMTRIRQFDIQGRGP